MKKKSVCILLLCILLLSICTVSISARSFRDVPAGAWYAKSVQYVSEHGLMNGVSEDRFDPTGTVSRGMIVTILYRMEKEPAVFAASTFADVAAGSYCEKAVAWASENGIVNGYSAAKFGPKDSITREQFAAILYRYCTYKQGDVSTKGNLSQYKDEDEIGSYARTAMLWANSHGLITGTSKTTLLPKGTATRAQAAAIIMRYAENMVERQAAEGENDSPTVPDEEDPSPADPGQEEPTGDEPVQESTQPMLKADKVSARVGEQVSIDIDIANNPGILGMTLTVSYDEQSLKLLKAESGAAMSDALTFVSAKSLKSGSSFVWYGMELSPEQVKDGAVLTLSFEVLDGAKGTLPIVLTAADGDIIDGNLQPVGVLMQNGSVCIQ